MISAEEEVRLARNEWRRGTSWIHKRVVRRLSYDVAGTLGTVDMIRLLVFLPLCLSSGVEIGCLKRVTVTFPLRIINSRLM